MNSLGYDSSLNNEENTTGRAGVKSTDQGSNTYDGIWHLNTESGEKPSWIQNDLDGVTTTFTDSTKWYSSLTDNDVTGNANATLDNNTNGKLYLKHNGIIWELTQTKTGENDSETITLSLKSYTTTVPNVYKGIKKLSEENQTLESTTKDTAYTFKTWTKPTSGAATNTGVTFEFKIIE